MFDLLIRIFEQIIKTKQNKLIFCHKQNHVGKETSCQYNYDLKRCLILVFYIFTALHDFVPFCLSLFF